MGGGSYSYAKDRAVKASYGSYSREEVFSQRKMSGEMNIYGKVRECRDSEEHPETLPIIIALDVTGSMGMIPHKLITGDFPEIMKKIMDEGISHPQVCFVGIGDHISDEAPIQVGQFEASDELLDKWLKTIWLEGHGGGNGGESYQLAWWFADKHVSADHIEKRGKKGILITIGDEPVHKGMDRVSVHNLFGYDPEVSTVLTSQVLKSAQEKWDIYHINLNDYIGGSHRTKSGWNDLLGDHFITTENDTGNDIAEIISGIILKSAGTDWTKPSAVKTETQTVTSETKTEHLR